jgi:hypothetical protein
MNSKTVIKDSIKALKLTDGSITTNGLEKATSLNDYFVSVFTNVDTSNDTSNAQVFQERCNKVCKEPKLMF